MPIYIDVKKIKRMLSGDPATLPKLVLLSKGEYPQLRDPKKIQGLKEAANYWKSIKKFFIIPVPNNGEFIVPDEPVIIKRGKTYTVAITPKKTKDTYSTNLYLIIKMGSVYQARAIAEEIATTVDEILIQTKTALENLVVPHETDSTKSEWVDPLFEEDALDTNDSNVEEVINEVLQVLGQRLRLLVEVLA